MSSTNTPPTATIRRALISVSDKTGIVELAQQLQQLDIEIISSGGTAQTLKDNNITVIEVSDYTGFPEMMGGRLKTLHPKIHGGILARQGIDDEQLAAHDIPTIDLVIVNLYPFEATIAQADCTLAAAIENIDVGGPTMIRAAAKNHGRVTILVDHQDYPGFIAELASNNGAIDEATKLQYAHKAFAHTAQYDQIIARYLATQITAETTEDQLFPEQLTIATHNKSQDLRYGENPHQQAAFYTQSNAPSGTISSARQLQGKPLSYNNIADSNTAIECVHACDSQFHACAIIKHANPCGAAMDRESQLQAYEKAYATDPESAFGGIIAFNKELLAETAEKILQQQFVEVIIAPQISADAQKILAPKKNLRLLACGNPDQAKSAPAMVYSCVNGGLLVQTKDLALLTADDLKVVTDRAPDENEIIDLLFSWNVAKFVKSNAIVLAKDRRTIGIGAGQMSRAFSSRTAIIKAADAELSTHQAVMASDAFFPFRDGVDFAAEKGICAVIQPGGSIRDEEVIAAANEHGIAMVFTGLRHFRH